MKKTDFNVSKLHLVSTTINAGLYLQMYIFILSDDHFFELYQHVWQSQRSLGQLQQQQFVTFKRLCIVTFEETPTYIYIVHPWLHARLCFLLNPDDAMLRIRVYNFLVARSNSNRRKYSEIWYTFCNVERKIKTYAGWIRARDFSPNFKVFLIDLPILNLNLICQQDVFKKARKIYKGSVRIFSFF